MKTTTGNILEAEGLKCIPVNMVGAAGKGLAKQWADTAGTPAVIMYRKACWSDYIRTNTLVLGEWWLFPTKDHWRDDSNLPQMAMRLITDLTHIATLRPERINVPKIGCGLGGLDWNNEVWPAIEPILTNFEQLYGSEVVIFE